MFCYDVLMLNEYMKERIEKRKLSPDTGKVSAVRLTKEASMRRHERTKISVSRHEKTVFTERY